LNIENQISFGIPSPIKPRKLNQILPSQRTSKRSKAIGTESIKIKGATKPIVVEFD